MAKSELHAALLEGSPIQAEIDLESEYRADGIAVYNKMRQRAEQSGDMLKPGEMMMRHWFGPLVAGITESRRVMLETGYGPGAAIISGPLTLIEPDMMAGLAVREVLGAMLKPNCRRGHKLTHLCYLVGRAVMAEINFQAIRKDVPHVAHILTTRVRRVDPHKIQWWSRKHLDDPLVDRRVAIALGAWLVDILVGTAFTGPVNDSDPAFRIEMRKERTRRTKWLVMHQRVFDYIADGHYMRQIMRPRFGPMVVPPYPWTHEYEGGFVKLRTPLISNMTRPQRDAMRREGSAELVYESLNRLSSCPWSVYGRVLDVAQEYWSRGGGKLGLPERDPEPYPPFPKGYRRDGETGAERWAEVDPETKKTFKRACRRLRERNIDLAGRRTESASILDLAQRHRDTPAIYLPHQLDFRGRCYPIPVHFNHHNSDLCRGLLRFANRVPVNTRWLAIHAANCYGVDKVPFDSRVEWVRNHAGDISRAVSDPIADEFWKAADKPWQFLAACYALDNDDEGAMLPVQLDGSNNGLQHYSAMMRDPLGGELVNLLPGSRPADVYMEVARAADELIGTDPNAVDGAREQLVRDVVKQPVMTQTYGVTAYGARGQIRGKLREKGLSDDDAKRIAAYLATQIEAGIEGMCPGARAAMDWLRDTARAVVATGKPIQWTSPIGMPVIQPYRDARKGRIVIKTTLGDMRTSSGEGPIDKIRQVNGFAPNFVHSVDASHLMMTCLAFGDQDMDFAGVHDSYWMHSGHCDDGHQIIRDQFVELHDTDVLDDLECELRALYPDADIPDSPARGNLDLQLVRQSTYLFH